MDSQEADILLGLENLASFSDMVLFHIDVWINTQENTRLILPARSLRRVCLGPVSHITVRGWD